MKKWLGRVAVALLLLVGVLFLFVNSIVGSAIEEGASRALGVETRVGFARLRVLDGTLRLNRVRIANPPGFEEPAFLAVDAARIEADLATARSEVVEIPLIRLQGVTVALERDGKDTNYGAILKNLRSFEKGDAEPAADDPGRRFVVRKLHIEDVDAYVEWSQLASKETGLRLAIPRIELRNLGGEGEALTSAELSSLIVQTILASIVRHGGGLPTAIIGGLDASLRDVTRVTGFVLEGVGKTGKTLAEKAAEGLEAVGEGAKKALGGIFGGERK